MRTILPMNFDPVQTPTWMILSPPEPLLIAGGILTGSTSPEQVFDWYRPTDDTHRYQFNHQDTLSGHLAPFVGGHLGQDAAAGERSFCMLAAQVGLLSADHRSDSIQESLNGRVCPELSESHEIDFDQSPKLAPRQVEQSSTSINFNEWPIETEPSEVEAKSLPVEPSDDEALLPKQTEPALALQRIRSEWPTWLELSEHAWRSELGTASFATFASFS